MPEDPQIKPELVHTTNLAAKIEYNDQLLSINHNNEKSSDE